MGEVSEQTMREARRIAESGTVIVCDWPSFRTPRGAE